MRTFKEAQRLARSKTATGLSSEMRKRLEDVIDSNSVGAIESGCDMLRGMEQQLDYPPRKVSRTANELTAVYEELLLLTACAESAIFKIRNIMV